VQLLAIKKGKTRMEESAPPVSSGPRRRVTRKKVILLAAAVIVAAAAGVGIKVLFFSDEGLTALSVTTPFAGRVTDVSADVGDSVNAGTKLATLVDDSKMTITQYFSYAYEDQIYMGMKAGISVASLICTNQGLSYYEPAEELSSALAGRRGTLLLDKSGAACGFLPDDTVSRTVTISDVSATGITDASGSFHSISNSVSVLLDDTLTTYGSSWYDLEGRDTVTLYYNQKGTADLVVASQAVAYEGVTLSGYYEGASPNTAAPDTITLLGIELPVADSGQSSLSQFGVGDRITVTLNGAGEVISAVSYSQQQVSQYGVLGNGEVVLSCGLTAKEPSATAAPPRSANW